MAIFSSNFSYHKGAKFHYVEKWMTNELFDILEAAVQKKYSNASLHELHNEWDLNRLFIAMGGEIGMDDAFVTFNFHVDKKGCLYNITVEV